MPRGTHCGSHPEPKASAGITAALAQAPAAPLEPFLAPPPPLPRPCLSWVTVTDLDPFGTATTVNDGEIVGILGTTRSQAEELP